MGYQIAEVSFSSRGADECAAVRLVGTTPGGHSGSPRKLTRRAEGGYYPCCTSATHVAMPPSFALGDNADLKANAAALRKDFGPRAPRQLAAAHRTKTFGLP